MDRCTNSCLNNVNLNVLITRFWPKGVIWFFTEKAIIHVASPLSRHEGDKSTMNLYWTTGLEWGTWTGVKKIWNCPKAWLDQTKLFWQKEWFLQQKKILEIHCLIIEYTLFKHRTVGHEVCNHLTVGHTLS